MCCFDALVGLVGLVDVTTAHFFGNVFHLFLKQEVPLPAIQPQGRSFSPTTIPKCAVNRAQWRSAECTLQCARCKNVYCAEPVV